jgi:hypothetical protein
MIVKALAALVALIAVFLVVAALQPADFEFSRNTLVAAPPAAVFAEVNDLHRWNDWSPWAKLDPAMKQVFEGPVTGEGAAYSWVGNSKVGEGKMTITRSQVPDLVLLRLDFVKPMATTNQTEFTFKPEGSGTRVTWTMTGQKNFIAKAFHLVVSMDKLIGPDFEKGLAQLKAVAEASK